MKFNYYLVFIISLFILACNNDEIDRDTYGNKNKLETKEENSEIKEESSKEELTRYEAILDSNEFRKDYFLENTKKFNFSNENNKDVFSIKIKGKFLYNSMVEFTITNSNGNLIYTDKFTTLTVLNKVFDGGGEYATFIQQDDYLKGWIKDFLTNEKFLTPAIMPERVVEEEHAHKQYWNEIKLDENAIGFSYSQSKETEIEIAFNKIQGRVVKYYQY